MPKHIIPRELYDKLTEAYRAQPGNASHAATVANCDWRTAKRAWDLGFSWTKDEYTRRAIRDIVTAEQEVTRARLEAERAQASKLSAEAEARRQMELKEQARRDVTESRAQEAQMIRLARGATVGLLVTLTNLAKGAARVGEGVKGALEKLGAKPELSAAEASSLTRLINTLSTSLRQANDAAQRAMEMERLLLGEPTSIVGLAHLEGIQTMDEAERRIQAALAAVKQAREDGVALDNDPPAPAAADDGPSFN